MGQTLALDLPPSFLANDKPVGAIIGADFVVTLGDFKTARLRVQLGAVYVEVDVVAAAGFFHPGRNFISFAVIGIPVLIKVDGKGVLFAVVALGDGAKADVQGGQAEGFVAGLGHGGDVDAVAIEVAVAQEVGHLEGGGPVDSFVDLAAVDCGDIGIFVA